MRKVTKKLISLGLVAALVVAGAATSTVSVDAKGKGKGNTETSTDSQKKDQKDKKGKKSKKDKKKQDICTGAAVTATGTAVDKGCGKSKKKKVVVEKLKSKCKAYKIKKKIAVKEENTIVIKCKNKVMLKDAAVEVTDEDGDIYEAEITGKKKGNIKVTVSGLEEGEEYTITVTGVKTKKENNYGSVTTAFATKK